MKLAARLILITMLGVVTLLMLDTYLAIRHQSEQYRADMEQNARIVGDALKGMIEDAWRNRGAEQALLLIGEANQHEHLLRIQWKSPQQLGRLLAQVGGGAQDNSSSVSHVGLDEDGAECLITYVPISSAAPEMGAIELSERLSVLQRHNRATIDKAAILASEIFVISGGAVMLLGVWLVGKPLQQLSDKARRVGSGDLASPLQMHRRDELGRLALAMNEMCEHLLESQQHVQLEQQKRMEALEQLRHADRLRTVGKLAAGVAHELGTPLNTIAIRAEMIAEDPQAAGECQRHALIIHGQTKRMSNIVQELLAYARPRSLHKAPSDLVGIGEQVREFLTPLAARHGIDLRLSPQAGLPIAVVDAAQLQQVLINLVSNGIQAMPDGGWIEIGVRTRDVVPPAGVEATPGAYFCISVQDQGIGIPEKNLPHIFDPFFTTKDVGQGSGLGLSIVYGIVQEHGGWIGVTSEPGKGSCFCVYLPGADTADVASDENRDGGERSLETAPESP